MNVNWDALMAPLLVPLVKIAVLVFGLLTAAAYLVLLERKFCAWMQDRRGPNRVGIPLTRIRLFGLGQPLADGLKFIFKEEYTPSHVDKALYILAPISILAAAIAVFAVVPFGSVLPLDLPGMKGQPIALIVAPGLDVGMIYVFALSSIAVYGVILGGWASNNKYSFLGGLRSSAQLIAYEIPLGLGILGVVLAAGSLRLDRIIQEQAASGVWNIFTQPLGFSVFLIAAFAEAARLPFDLPECEQELVGGYHTEYAGMKLLLFLIAEFLHMLVASYLIVILFFGGWHFWGMSVPADGAVAWPEALLRVAVMMAKVLGVILFFMMVRWSWPRFRFDQLMNLAWKVMLPLGLVNLVAVACVLEYAHVEGQEQLPASPWMMIGVGWFVAFVGWIAAALLAPLHTDNRPRMEALAPPEFEPEEALARENAPRRRPMKSDDKNVKWIEEPKLGLSGKMYLPLFVQGLSTTARHLFGPKVTVSYPEVRPRIDNPLIYRGVHRLNKDEKGRVKCVACFLCATACPAHCIDIVGIESPWPDREKYPQSFTIDELRCIYCGMCEEACPVDAIELTSLFDLTGRSREEMIFDKEKLLGVYDQTKDSEPMKSEALGGTL